MRSLKSTMLWLIATTALVLPTEALPDDVVKLHQLGIYQDHHTNTGAMVYSLDEHVDGDWAWAQHLNHTREQEALVRRYEDPYQGHGTPDIGIDAAWTSWYCSRFKKPRKGVGSCSYRHNMWHFGQRVGNNTRFREITRQLIYRAIDHGYPGEPSHGFHSECLYFKPGPLFCISWPEFDQYYEDWGGSSAVRTYTTDHFSPEFVDYLSGLSMFCYHQKSSAHVMTTDKRREMYFMCFSDRHTGCGTRLCHPWHDVIPEDINKWEYPEGDDCPDGSLEDWPQCKGTMPKDPDEKPGSVRDY